ncbi:FAD-dependent hydroxylase [Phormidium sp. FACHB-1136]|uniref:FAD-dependent hydroxylase n=1 Tax=Phormidium sp. FACHB-1136 TaxID=2692848 RepID=UPI0016869652|nr:FAD-dependent hydroxylase [Phormidium sp. FACHB-1136]MBD2426510.1 FAD-dependent hydroxylase [Phormidium sp. FACHB-1136]
MTTTYPAPMPASPSSLPPLSVDIAIVGGGLVGLTLAAALRPSGLRVAVIEAQTPEGAASRQRAYAFSPTSADIMKGLGLWPQVGPKICHFQQVRLSDGDHPEVVKFSPQDLGDESVFYGAEHGVLMEALQGAVQAAANIHYLSESTLTVTERHGERVVGTLTTPEGTRTLDAALVVAADGKQSPLRRQANIDAFGWQYWQSCITTVLEPEGDHQSTAYERFWPSGPFAILPLPGGRCQVVWTSPHEEAQAILNLPEAEFMAELERRYGSQMGKLKRLTPPALFPVQLMQCDRYIQPRLALVGDAAHSCHPVGGQGLNMGLRDAAALAEVLTAAHHKGQDLGAVTVLRRYERWRRWENWVILSFTDTLTRSFSNQIAPIVALRRTGLWVLTHVSPLRHLALRLMTGRLGRVPKLALAGRRQS